MSFRFIRSIIYYYAFFLKKNRRESIGMSNLPELRQIAKSMGVRGYSVLKKNDLITAIEQHKGMAQVKAQVMEEATPVVEVKEVKAEAPAKKERKPNEWNAYLADYRAKNNLSLRQAMAAAKAEYAELKGKKAEGTKN